MDRNLAVAIAGCGVASVSGRFHRHVVASVRDLTGNAGGGRWGAPGGFSVLYLGRPAESVIVEAYRHLVESSENMTSDMVRPRRLITADVAVTNILDLRIPKNCEAVGLTDADLTTAPGEYAACQRVGRAAHQLGLHGIIAPAATRLGETLALYEFYLPSDEQPLLVAEEEWPHLPPDPRVLRVLADAEESTG